MSLLTESIRLENGKLYNIELHQSRMDRARRELFQCDKPFDLIQQIHIDREYQGVHRVRVSYQELIEKVEITPYQRRNIKFLKLITDNDIDYTYKYADRKRFDKYITEPGQDILIVKNGFITDTSFSNIVFFDGSMWVTPNTPLLKGTMRAFLLQEKIIIEETISLNDLVKYKKFRCINAFNGFDNPFEFEINMIKI
jgi:4-amino-4-deoxychorismate lyase